MQTDETRRIRHKPSRIDSCILSLAKWGQSIDTVAWNNWFSHFVPYLFVPEVPEVSEVE
jgi:hypothetical protein